MSDHRFITLNGYAANPLTKEFGGTTVTVISVASRDSMKQGDQWVDNTTWFEVEFPGEYGAKKAASVHKGDYVTVSGNLVVRVKGDKTYHSIRNASISVVRRKQDEGTDSPF